MRFDMLTLLEDLIESEYAQSSLPFQSVKIMQKILIPSCVWKPGKPNIKIRKAAVTCMIKIIDKNLINKEELYKLYKDIFAVIKSCLDDDWAADLRFASCAFMKKFLMMLGDLLKSIFFIF